MTVSAETAHRLLEELFLIGRTLRTSLQPHIGHDLLPGGLGVLVVLAATGPSRQTDLAARLSIGPSALSRHVTDLAAAGYLSRRPDPTDGRASLIDVTDEGRAMIEHLRESRKRQIEEVLGDWTEAEVEQAYLAVRKLRDSLNSHTHRSVASA